MALEGIFENVIRILNSITPVGVEPVYFYSTFMLVLSLTYMLFYNLIPVFQKNKGVSFIAAVVFAYFAASSAFVTIIVSKLFPNVGLAIMAILGILLVVAFVTPKSFTDKGTPAANLIMLGAVIFIIFATYTYAAPELAAQGYISPNLGTNISSEDWAIIIIMIVVIGGLYMMFRPAPTGTSNLERFMKWGLGPKP
jgi:hypothetical protein